MEDARLARLDEQLDRVAATYASGGVDDYLLVMVLERDVLVQGPPGGRGESWVGLIDDRVSTLKTLDDNAGGSAVWDALIGVD